MRMRTTKRAFTLIELLIVVVVIGILATIAIPKFSAMRQKSYIASVTSDLKNLASQQEIYLSNEGPGIIEAFFERPLVFADEMEEGEEMTYRSDNGVIEVFLSTTSTEHARVRVEGRDASRLTVTRAR